MHLVSIDARGRTHPGVIAGDRILDLVACARRIPAAGGLPDSMRGLLAAGDPALDIVRRILDDVRADRGGLATALREDAALTTRSTTRLLAPLPAPGMILAGGMNYHEHLKEMNTPVPDKPVSFVKSSAAVIGPGAPIVLPAAHPDMVDWEGEFSAVFGRRCHNVREDEALACIAGYTLINDVSARDWVPPVFKAQGVMGAIQAWEHNILGKQYPTFCPLGPSIATKDELPDPGSAAITTTLNGTVMQSASADDLVFPLEALIAYYSQFYCFEPGDVITTGSPSGVGFGRKPPLFMQAGDTIAVAVAEIGTLANPVTRG